MRYEGKRTECSGLQNRTEDSGLRTERALTPALSQSTGRGGRTAGRRTVQREAVPLSPQSSVLISTAFTRAALLLAVGILAAACNSNPQAAADKVSDGEVALGGNRFDAAVADADESIRLSPTAPAYYLRARAEEDRPKPDANIAAADLSKAKTDYQTAIDLHPGAGLTARSRAGLANIAFTQNDYSLAVFNLTMAVDDLEQPEWRANALYRIGESQQRLGRFDDADKTFKRLSDEYPDQDVATKARTREGVRAFYLQIGAFKSQDDARKAMVDAKNAGLACDTVADHGLVAVRGGPYTSYADAVRAKATVAQQFPDAIVGP